MAFVSIDSFRSLASVTETSIPDGSAGAFLGAASALVNSITGRELGHYVESFTQVDDTLRAVSYGHMLEDSGCVWIARSGNASLSGKYAYEVIDDDTISIKGALAPSGVSNFRIMPRYVGDFDVMDNFVSLHPTPAYKVEEVRVDQHWGDSIFSDGDDPFSDADIVDESNYYVPKESRSIFNSEIQFRHGCFPVVKARVRGFVGAVRRQMRRVARVTYYCGTTSVPMDLAMAIAVIANQISTDAAGEFQSESYDYYSYSKRSLNELKDYPVSAIATLSRYAVSR